MHERRGRSGRALMLVVALSGALAGPVSAQLPSASAAALGFGGNYTALARGYEAMAWNPALLALLDGPDYSLTVLSPGAAFGLKPVSWPTLAGHVDGSVPASTRQAWLNKILANGGENGFANGGLTYLALSTGNFGMQVSTAMSGVVRVSPDVARLALGGTPVGGSLSATDGSRMDLAVTSTVAASYAAHFSLHIPQYPHMELVLGATVKYTIGHFFLTGRPETVLTGPNAGQLGFVVAQVDSGLARGSNGSGVGIDFGGALRNGPWVASLAVLNAMNSFNWSDHNFVSRPIGAVFGALANPLASTTVASAGPADLDQRVLSIRYPQVIALGFSYRRSRRLLLTADAREQSSAGMDLGAASRVGVGGQYQLTPLLAVRAGAALRSDGYELGAGLGFHLDGFGIALSGGLRHTGFGTGTMAALTASYAAHR